MIRILFYNEVVYKQGIKKADCPTGDRADSMLVFRLGTVVLLGIVLHFGTIGVWVEMGMDWLALSIAFTIRFWGGKRIAFRVI